MSGAAELLHPRPKRLSEGGSWVTLGPMRVERCGLLTPRAVQRTAMLAGILPRHGPPLVASVLRDDRLAAEAYRLTFTEGRLTIEAATDAAVLWGLETFDQWIRLAGDGARVPAVSIDDAPDLAVRGVLLDISRDKVPSQATALELVDLLARWKINQLQLYMEHTFAYAGHEQVWREASPFLPGEVRELDQACLARGIELVANQNSFGHFHRWLRHPRYRPLAECPEGIEHPFSDEIEPFSLCAVDSRSLALLAELYDQLLPCFQSTAVNVGLDETFDLGRGRSAAACAERGRHQVYLEFVRAVHGLLRERGRTMQMWADILLEQDDQLAAALPEDVVPIAWGYEADHPFDEQAARLAGSGRPFLLCPGTSSWLSFAGRAGNCLGNLEGAARAAAEHGAGGLLVADWGDQGHLQPLSSSMLGFLAGAGAGWNPQTPPAQLPLAELLDAHVFEHHSGHGARSLALADLYRLTGTRNVNGSALFHLLASPHGLDHPRYAGLSEDGLVSITAAADEHSAALGEGDIWTRELRWVASLLSLAARLGRIRLTAGPRAALAELPAAGRRPLAAALGQAIDEHAVVWNARNRPGGRADSVRRLTRTRDALAGE